MTRSTVVEAAGQAVGILVPEESRYRFVAVKYPVWQLDGTTFPSAELAREAAQALMARSAAAPQHV
ncbi:hypothetical protein [Oharaeibacter diazotrophicus]|uniref:Uncharacterized protein n=1 Tax=Oharaeibacter diazotrophicus TaxID=1920512 RepID=A0A4R6RBW1_9HYPH|nr:hypothetical protein [Oharaeibacter diazotrophicus]TDP83534.1 hypothetical protein EDD54_3496 [Oharaeibacter diazotrophicus]BBE72367.1 hypothetical protein OHA_1_01957 [Pleomorphomonas sp. SM30]GLS79138.1 hypothetical protein GCM10007904_44750 [Oharaeibacter diazotrophicus]